MQGTHTLLFKRKCVKIVLKIPGEACFITSSPGLNKRKKKVISESVLRKPE